VGQAAREKGRDAVQVSEEHGMGAHVRESSGRKTRPCGGGEEDDGAGSGEESVGRSGMGSPVRRKTKSVVPSWSPSTSSERSSSRGAPMAVARVETVGV